MKNTVITVRLWGEEVGRLMWDERKGTSGEECDITFGKGMSKMTDYENGVQ